MAAEETDTTVQQRLWDVPAAFVLLTRLPLPRLPNHAFAQGARAVWAYPLVGLVLGGMAALIGWVALLIGLSPMLAAGLMLAALVLLTGAMHEDGLADTADGLWGGQDAARRLEIMKDSRIGAYGMLALILAMGLRWLGLAEVGAGGLVAALVMSRAMMTPLMLALPHARETGLAHSVGRPDAGPVITAMLIAATCGIVLAGGPGLVALIIAGGVAAGIGALAKAKIGGQTGDILGAAQVCTEIAVLLTLAALI
ncbi:adenosylcobinamide-GDP ribazoletransferase [uncultured Tateyamaria sp.]|uniref:adenosylcobinamide-GDP ribazoletransferase n=1 Tax=uncultured Tateyamaria sp. TaxID=455651 RepID=UPI00262B65F6|nr:adenosylcobinamide-GDP ribazoletransferase [uncultured Tateyamaria sp.]